MHKPTAAFAASLLPGASSFAQVNTASLAGLVKDSSDAAITGAKISAANTAFAGDPRLMQFALRLKY